MALGDIHNHNGSICKAHKRPCPLGDGGHSKTIEEYVEHNVKESGLDGEAVRSMIADGTPPADAVAVVKGGGGSVANSLSYVDLTEQQRELEDEMDQQNLEETYGYLRELKGNTRKREVARAESYLRADFSESMYEAKLSNGYDDETDVPANPSAKYEADVERIHGAMKDSLAAIHAVSKHEITTNPDGSITVERGDGYVSQYNKDYSLDKVKVDISDTQKALIREIDEENFSHLQELEGDERKRAVADAEYELASAYKDSIDDVRIANDYDDSLPKHATREYHADVERAREMHRDVLAMIHDVPYDKVTENDKGEIEIARENGMVSVYKSDFTFKDVEDR